jgi:hypothetical protein
MCRNRFDRFSRSAAAGRHAACGRLRVLFAGCAVCSAVRLGKAPRRISPLLALGRDGLVCHCSRVSFSATMPKGRPKTTLTWHEMDAGDDRGEEERRREGTAAARRCVHQPTQHSEMRCSNSTDGGHGSTAQEHRTTRSGTTNDYGIKFSR